MRPLWIRSLWFLKRRCSLPSLLNLRHSLWVDRLNTRFMDNELIAVLSPMYPMFRWVLLQWFLHFQLLNLLLLWYLIFFISNLLFHFFFYFYFFPLLFFISILPLINLLVLPWTFKCYGWFWGLVPDWCLHCFCDTGSLIKWKSLWSLSSKDKILLTATAYISRVFLLFLGWVLFDHFRYLLFWGFSIFWAMPDLLLGNRSFILLGHFFIIRYLNLFILWADWFCILILINCFLLTHLIRSYVSSRSGLLLLLMN